MCTVHWYIAQLNVWTYLFVYRLYVCFPMFEFGLDCQCVLVSGVEGWVVGRRGRGAGQGTKLLDMFVRVQ